ARVPPQERHESASRIDELRPETPHRLRLCKPPKALLVQHALHARRPSNMSRLDEADAMECLIALASQRRQRGGPDLDRAVHAPREMHAEAWHLQVRHRVDQSIDAKP